MTLLRGATASPRTLAVALLGLSAAACGASGGAGASSGPATGSQDASVVRVEAFEFGFTPAAITVPAGEVTFAVTNTGTVEHEFEVFLGDAVVDEVEGLVPGLTRDLKVTLEPGNYTYVCKLAGHEQAGMQGALTVTE